MTMTVEQMMMYAAVAAVGWLLRHYGVGAGLKVPGSPSPAVHAAPVASPSPPVNPHLPVLTTVKAEADAAVNAAVEAAVQKALSDLKTSLGAK